MSKIFFVLHLLASGVFFSPPSMALAVTLDQLEASVNTSLILLSDVKKFRDTLPLRAQLDPLFTGTSLSTKGAGAPTAEIVEFLINEKLIAQQFPIQDADVEQEINSIQANNHIDRNKLKSALKDQGFLFDDYFELIRSSAAKRNLIDRDIRTKVSISDEDVKNYFFNKFGRSTSLPLAYKVKIITISPKTYKSSAAIKAAAAKAYQQIRGGESFEEVAKRTSDAPSASSGGDLGELTEDQMSAQIKQELKKLKINQVSPILSSSDGGFMILKLIDVKSTEIDRLEKMKEEIRSQLAAAEYQHQISLWLQRQRQKSFIHLAGQPAILGQQ